MTNILSNRFFQGGIAIAAIAIAFFGYQNFSSEEVSAEVATQATDSEQAVTTSAEVTEGTDAIEDNVENAVNNTEASDTINTADEEATAE